METPICSIVSPHLLDTLANSNDPQAQESARKTIAHSHHIRTRRKEHFEYKAKTKAKANKAKNEESPLDIQSIVPDQILNNVASSETTDTPTREQAQHTLEIKQTLQNVPTIEPTAPTTTPNLHRKIYTMQNHLQPSSPGQPSQTFTLLPGTLIRSEGDAPISDLHANQAYDNCLKVLTFFQEVFNYTFLDDGDAPIISSIHFEKEYQNAQWVGGEARQMVYGDGGRDIGGFTGCLDVIGHEMGVRSPFFSPFPPIFPFSHSLI